MFLDLPNTIEDKKTYVTKVHFCFTAKSKKYALALLNTVKNAKFNSWSDLTIFAGDNEAISVFNKYNVPYRKSYGINVYHDRILNCMQLSIENKDTIILAPDVMVSFDYKDTKRKFGKLKYQDNSLYLFSRHVIGFALWDKIVCGTYNTAYNVTKDKIQKYVKGTHTVAPFIVYTNTKSKQRYDNEQHGMPTDEEVLHVLRKELNVILDDDQTSRCLLSSTYFCYGGNTLDYIIKNHLQYYMNYYVNPEIQEELWSCI